MQRVCRQLDGAFTLVAVDAQDPDRVVAARRNSPLVVGLGEGENFLGSDVAAFIEHTREALELGQDQVVTITRDDGRGHRLRRQAGRGQALPRRLGPLGRREGRLRLVHAQGDLRAAARGRRLAARPRTPDGLLQLDEMRLVGRGAPRHRQDHHHRAAAPRSTPAWSRSTRSSTGRGSRARSSSRREFRYRDPILDRATLVVAISQSGETADTLMAIRHARSSGPRCSRSATPTARRSRASPTR